MVQVIIYESNWFHVYVHIICITWYHFNYSFNTILWTCINSLKSKDLIEIRGFYSNQNLWLQEWHNLPCKQNYQVANGIMYKFHGLHWAFRICKFLLNDLVHSTLVNFKFLMSHDVKYNFIEDYLTIRTGLNLSWFIGCQVLRG